MALTSISKADFDEYHPPHLILEVLVSQQVEWFANTGETVIGTIAGKNESGWKFAVLNRDARGHFRIYKLGGNSYSRESAQTQLHAEMESAEKAGTAPTGSLKVGGR